MSAAVVPLAFAVGAGAEMRQAMGTAVFAGLIGATAFGLVFTPLFFVLTARTRRGNAAPERAGLPAEAA